MDENERGLEADVTLPAEIDPATATPEQVAELQKTVKTLEAQKGHWKKNAINPTSGKKYRDEAPKAPVVTPPATTTDEGKETVERLSRLEQSEEKRQFGSAHNLSPEAVDEVFAAATGLKITPEKALERPFVKAGLEALHRQQRVNGATPGSSHRSPTVEGKTFAELKPEDRKANFGKVVAGLQKK